MLFTDAGCWNCLISELNGIHAAGIVRSVMRLRYVLDGSGFDSRQEARNLCVLQYIQKYSEARSTSYSTDRNTGTVFLFGRKVAGVCSWPHTYMQCLSVLDTDIFPLIGAFTKLRKVTISFVMILRLSVRMEQIGSHWTDFHEIFIQGFL